VKALPPVPTAAREEIPPISKHGWFSYYPFYGPIPILEGFPVPQMVQPPRIDVSAIGNPFG